MTADEKTRRRLDDLEDAARGLLFEVARLRRETGESPKPMAGAPEPRQDPPKAEPAGARAVHQFGASREPPGVSGEDLEGVVGRYGAMGLAALAIVSGVGIFLRWAIESGLLTPEVRVIAGFLAACALAAAGWHFRRRGALVFGNTLLGVSLAVMHVVAWAAGPLLDVVPLPLALGAASLSSIALAALAVRAGEQSLFFFGAGGALIAPFVTSAGRGNGYALLAYGLIVIGAALGAIRDRDWRWARWLLATGAFLYAGAAMTAAWSIEGRWGREVPALFALACAWAALATGGPIHSRPLVRSHLAAALVPLLYTYDQVELATSHAIIAGLGTVTIWAAIHLREEEGSAWVIAAFLLPFAFLLTALLPLPDVFSPTGAILAASWGLGAVVAGQLAPGTRREMHWTVASLAIAVALVLWLQDREMELIWGLSGLGALVAVVMRRERALLLAASSAIVLSGAALLAGIEFDVRAPYAYTPFLTRASLAALPVVAGWWVFGVALARTEWASGGIPAAGGSNLNALGWIAAFLWVRAELAEAWSFDIATFLLIAFYAITGVTAIFVGGRHDRILLRRTGLGLAIYAALKAVVQAYGLTVVGLKVGSFLLVGMFLLAVAYWYRDAGEGRGLRVEGGG